MPFPTSQAEEEPVAKAWREYYRLMEKLRNELSRQLVEEEGYREGRRLHWTPDGTVTRE